MNVFRERRKILFPARLCPTEHMFYIFIRPSPALIGLRSLPDYTLKKSDNLLSYPIDDD